LVGDRGVSGGRLARQFHAGRLGSGSDVLRLDDEISRDHDWGCRLTPLVDGANLS
jgi:hypothetical protein